MVDVERPALQLEQSPAGAVDILDVPRDYEQIMPGAVQALGRLGYNVSCMSVHPNRIEGIDLSEAQGRVWGFWPRLDDEARTKLSEHLGATVLPVETPEESSQVAA